MPSFLGLVFIIHSLTFIMFEGMIGENKAVEVNFEVQLTGNKVKRMKNFHTTMIQPADS